MATNDKLKNFVSMKFYILTFVFEIFARQTPQNLIIVRYQFVAKTDFCKICRNSQNLQKLNNESNLETAIERCL